MILRDHLLWPEVLPVLLLVPIAWLLLLLADRRRARRLARALGPRTPVLAGDLGEGERRMRRRLTTATLLALLIAILQPVWGDALRTISQRGVDLLICLDVSRSMLARDVLPDRLEAAKEEIRALAERARGDRLGLVLFAGEARLSVPLTQDVDSFLGLLEAADPLSVERGGTDLGAALDRALEALKGESGDHEAVLLITDGEDLEERGLRAAQRCGARRIKVHCVGMGSPRGSKIAVTGPGGESFLRDRTGREVVSAMDPTSLRRIAEAAGGEFVDAGIRPRPLVSLYEKRIVPMARKAFAEETRDERESRFQWPLLVALLLGVVELCLTDRRRT